MRCKRFFGDKVIQHKQLPGQINRIQTPAALKAIAALQLCKLILKHRHWAGANNPQQKRRLQNKFINQS